MFGLHEEVIFLNISRKNTGWLVLDLNKMVNNNKNQPMIIKKNPILILFLKFTQPCYKRRTQEIIVLLSNKTNY